MRVSCARSVWSSSWNVCVPWRMLVVGKRCPKQEQHESSCELCVFTAGRQQLKHTPACWLWSSAYFHSLWPWQRLPARKSSMWNIQEFSWATGSVFVWMRIFAWHRSAPIGNADKIITKLIQISLLIPSWYWDLNRISRKNIRREKFLPWNCFYLMK